MQIPAKTLLSGGLCHIRLCQGGRVQAHKVAVVKLVPHALHRCLQGRYTPRRVEPLCASKTRAPSKLMDECRLGASQRVWPRCSQEVALPLHPPTAQSSPSAWKIGSASFGRSSQTSGTPKKQKDFGNSGNGSRLHPRQESCWLICANPVLLSRVDLLCALLLLLFLVRIFAHPPKPGEVKRASANLGMGTSVYEWLSM